CGRVISVRTGAPPDLAAPPSPEIPLFGAGLPPLMLTPIEFSPAPSPPPVPPPLPGAPALPVAPGAVVFGEPPGTPPFSPPAKIEIRAPRLPAGGSTGAAGAGLADNAMSAVALPSAALSRALTSGAATASPVRVRSATRGAAPEFNSSFGRA